MFLQQIMMVSHQIFCVCFFGLTSCALGYKIYSLDSPNVCNSTIWLEEGPKSAAILRLTNRKFYDFSPRFCTVTFKAPQHSWSGLTGILEQLDLRQYKDTPDHHLSRYFCIDYIRVRPEKPSAMPHLEQCGTWSVLPKESLTHIGYKRELIGYCPNRPSTSVKCDVSEISVEVSIGQERRNTDLWQHLEWEEHRGFSFVVTAYSYSFGKNICAKGLRSCNQSDRDDHQHHCVHESLWCDGHINCGYIDNIDEMFCRPEDDLWNWLCTYIVWLWAGIAILFIIVILPAIFWRYCHYPGDRLCSHSMPGNRNPTSVNHEFNSYAESFELSSNLSSAHHMAIQVRVVCGSNKHNTPHWQNDLPPAYDSLFPQGPPEAVGRFHEQLNAFSASVTTSVSSAIPSNLTISATAQSSSAACAADNTPVISTSANDLNEREETINKNNTVEHHENLQPFLSQANERDILNENLESSDATDRVDTLENHENTMLQVSPLGSMQNEAESKIQMEESQSNLFALPLNNLENGVYKNSPFSKNHVSEEPSCSSLVDKENKSGFEDVSSNFLQNNKKLFQNLNDAREDYMQETEVLNQNLLNTACAVVKYDTDNSDSSGKKD